MAIQKVFRRIGFIEESHEQVFREIFWTATHQPFMLPERLIEISKNINYSEVTLNIYVDWYRNELKSCSDSN